MISKSRVVNLRAVWVGLVWSFCLGFIVSSAGAQTSEDTTRKLWDTAFINPAKQSATARRNPIKGRQVARRYRVATPAVPTTNVAADTVVGVTIWRLRRSTSGESGERLLVHHGNDSGEWIPERISATTRLAEGDRLRITVEAARTGYMYVIDREQYADGTFSEPYLIFPTTRTLGGNNEVKAGKVIEIPAQDDSPPYFSLRRSRPDQVAEVLSILVTPTPLEDIEITDQAQKLSMNQVAAWEKSWSTQVGRLEMEDGVGSLWTKEEREAGADGNRVLGADAPAPQDLYYRPNTKASDPMLLQVQLRYRGANRR